MPDSAAGQVDVAGPSSMPAGAAVAPSTRPAEPEYIYVGDSDEDGIEIELDTDVGPSSTSSTRLQAPTVAHTQPAVQTGMPAIPLAKMTWVELMGLRQ